jgi:hypothetical protein
MPDDDRELVPADHGRRDAGSRRVRRGVSAVAVALALAGPVQAQPPFTCPRVVAWDANDEPDILGYTVAWGIGSRAYGRSVTVGAAVTSVTLHVPHGTTYVGAAAFNTERHASAYGDEIVLTCRVGDARLPQRLPALTGGLVVRNVPVS